MIWRNLKDEIPDSYVEVFVRKDMFQDGTFEYFIARLDQQEDEWAMTLHIAGLERPTTVFFNHPTKSTDKWAYFEGPLNGC
ncbi:MAG: hypothetical protein K1000chlam2_00026 [Chlamydiae bacterium]|nr:hypothetical protein [Chlamydiota bacterium]